jgi:hypothetical protein
MSPDRAKDPCASVSEFHDSDFSLLKSVVTARGDLHAAALACKLIVEKCTFPIQDANQIAGAILKGPGSYVDLAGHAVAFEDATTFLTADLFPIDNVDDLAHKVLLAFDRQNTVAQAREVIASIERLRHPQAAGR